MESRVAAARLHGSQRPPRSRTGSTPSRAHICMLSGRTAPQSSILLYAMSMFIASMCSCEYAYDGGMFCIRYLRLARNYNKTSIDAGRRAPPTQRGHSSPFSSGVGSSGTWGSSHSRQRRSAQHITLQAAKQPRPPAQRARSGWTVQMLGRSSGRSVAAARGSRFAS